MLALRTRIYIHRSTCAFSADVASCLLSLSWSALGKTAMCLSMISGYVGCKDDALDFQEKSDTFSSR